MGEHSNLDSVFSVASMCDCFLGSGECNFESDQVAFFPLAERY
uniref:Uncharacterized protein n=1 Tax=Anguilla anguilla TaxID=7936 RepID=A0A0E9QLB8_ANGAN